MDKLCFNPDEVKPVASSEEGLTDECLLDTGTGSTAPITCAKKLRMIRQVYRPGGRHRPHSHENTEQAYYIIKGKAYVRIGDREYYPKEGAILYIPPKVEHEIKNIGETDLVNLLISADV